MHIVFQIELNATFPFTKVEVNVDLTINMYDCFVRTLKTQGDNWKRLLLMGINMNCKVFLTPH